MADIAKINLDGTTYTLKDATARTAASAAEKSASQAKANAESALSASGTNTTAIAAINGKTFAKASYGNETLTLTNTLIGG